MRSPSSLGLGVLVLYFLCSVTLSSRLPVDEVFRRQLCVEDDALLSFQQYSEDSVPFCSSYLSIAISTSTELVTGRTTTTTTTTVTTGIDVDATTVPTGTVTVTTTAGPVDKRQFVTPASVLIAACTLSPQNESIISTVSSACSCLTVTPSVFDSTATVTSTRTLTAINYIQATISGTAFEQITTTETVHPLVVNATIVPASSGTAPPSTSVPLSSSNTATILSPSNSVILKSPFPISSSSSGPPVANSTAPASSALPGATSPSSSASNGPSGSSTMAPSTASTPPFPTSGPQRSAPAISGSSSGVPVAPGSSNITTSTSTSPGLSTTSLPSLGRLCPVENGTEYTTHGQTFLILCYINFPGPSTQGLDEPDLYACINDCATVNLGFSQDSCWAASYFPNTIDNQNCFFRDKEDSQLPYTSSFTISALLIGGLPNATTNATSGFSPTVSPSGSISISINSTVTSTSLSSVSITSLISASLSVSIGTSSAPSGNPTISANNSSGMTLPFSLPGVSDRSGYQSSTASSGSPVISSNSSSIGFPTISAPSGLPTISANSSSSAGASASYASGLATVSSNSTLSGGSPSSGVPTLSSNRTSMSTPSGSATSSPSGLPTISSNSSTPTVPPFTLPVSDRSGFQISTRSGLPRASANVTFMPSISSTFPSISINISSSHSLVIPVASDNKTTGLPPSTHHISLTLSGFPTISSNMSATSAGFPTISSNVTVPPFSQPTNPLNRNASFTTAPQNCSACSPITVVTSHYTSIWTTTIVETSTSATVITQFRDRKVARSPSTSGPRLE